MSTIIYIFILLGILVLVFKMAKAFFKVVLLLSVIIGIVLILHPVCQTELDGKTLWQFSPAEYISRVVPAKTFTFESGETYCKIWTGVQSFF